jgi:hypothetical protein
MKQTVEIRRNNGEVFNVTISHNNSHYATEDLAVLLQWSLSIALPPDHMGRSQEYGTLAASVRQRNESDPVIAFDKYGGKKDCMIRVQHLDGWNGGAIKIRIKAPTAILSSVEHLAAVGAVADADLDKYTAAMPGEIVRRLGSELVSNLIKTTYRPEHHNYYDALPQHTPPLRVRKRVTALGNQQKVEEAWIQLDARSEWYFSDLGEDLNLYVDGKIKHLKYMLRRAKIVENQSMVASIEAAIAQLDMLRVAVEPLSTYAATARAEVAANRSKETE